MTAYAVDRVGLPTDVTQTLTTVAPSKFLDFSVTPKADATVGVGLPIKMQLDHQAQDRRRQAGPREEPRGHRRRRPGRRAAGTGSPTTSLEYRPETYWPGNADITVTANLKGVKFTKSLWGEKNRSITFHTGPAMVSYVDMQTHKLRVTKNGKTIRIIPITTGKAGLRHPLGRQGDHDARSATRLMDASTGGTDRSDPEYYRLEVEYAMRLTWIRRVPPRRARGRSRSQGRANVSHGCTGMSTSQRRVALRQLHRRRRGRLHRQRPRRWSRGNGIGLWNISWKKWQQGSALAA